MDRAEILIKNESTTKIIDRLRRVGTAVFGDGGGNFVDYFELDKHFNTNRKSLPAQFASSANPRLDFPRL